MSELSLNLQGLGFNVLPFQSGNLLAGSNEASPLFNSEVLPKKIASISSKITKLENLIKESGSKMSKKELAKYKNAIQQGKEAINRYRAQISTNSVQLNQVLPKDPEIKLNERGTYDVKLAGQPNRTFSSKVDAQKFIDKQLNNKYSEVYPHSSGKIYNNMLSTSNPVKQEKIITTGSPWSQGAWSNQRTDLVGELPLEQQVRKGGSPWSQGAWSSQRVDLVGEIPLEQKVKKSYVKPEINVKSNIAEELPIEPKTKKSYVTPEINVKNSIAEELPIEPKTKKPYVTPEISVKQNVAKKKGFFANVKKLFKGKKGKFAIAAAAVGLVAGAVAMCKSNNKKDEKIKEKEVATPIENKENKDKEVSIVSPEQNAVVKEPENKEKVNIQAESKAIINNVEQEELKTGVVQNNDSIDEIAKRYDVSVDEIKKLNKDKIKQFKNEKGETYEGFLVGENIKLPEKSKEVANLKNGEESVKIYEEALIKNFDKIPQTMWDEICTPEFRKKHNLGEYKKAA